MFILRQITEKNGEINTCLGIEYVLVLRDRNYEEFKNRTKLWNQDDLTDIYGVVCFDGGESLIPLHTDTFYYVMTSDGRTFANVSYHIVKQ